MPLKNRRTAKEKFSKEWNEASEDVLKRYPSVEDLVYTNRFSLERIKAKRADAHDVIGGAALGNLLRACKRLKGDVYDKAACFMREIVQKHPFGSGNRRTAFLVAQTFLDTNGKKLNIEDNPSQSRTMLGVREGFYKAAEITKWLRKGEIREFKRKI